MKDEAKGKMKGTNAMGRSLVEREYREERKKERVDGQRDADSSASSLREEGDQHPVPMYLFSKRVFRRHVNAGVTKRADTRDNEEARERATKRRPKRRKKRCRKEKRWTLFENF